MKVGERVRGMPMAVDLVNDKPSNNRSWCVGNAPYALKAEIVHSNIPLIL